MLPVNYQRFSSGAATGAVGTGLARMGSGDFSSRQNGRVYERPSENVRPTLPNSGRRRKTSNRSRRSRTAGNEVKPRLLIIRSLRRRANWAHHGPFPTPHRCWWVRRNRSPSETARDPLLVSSPREWTVSTSNAEIAPPPRLAGEVVRAPAGGPKARNHPLAIGDGRGRATRIGPVHRLLCAIEHAGLPS